MGQRNGEFEKQTGRQSLSLSLSLSLFLFKHRSKTLLVNGICESFPCPLSRRGKLGLSLAGLRDARTQEVSSLDLRAGGGSHGILRDIVQVSELGLASFILLPSNFTPFSYVPPYLLAFFFALHGPRLYALFPSSPLFLSLPTRRRPFHPQPLLIRTPRRYVFHPPLKSRAESSTRRPNRETTFY